MDASTAPFPARRLRDALEPLAAIGYHAPAALAAYDETGLDFIHGYVWGRASSLGAPEPAVVAAAFGVFQPELVETTYREARVAVDLSRMRELRLRGATASLRDVLGDPGAVEGLEETVTALEGAVRSASTLGRPLFGALAGHPRPPDLLGRLWLSTSCLREHRGDAHLAALLGAGVDGVQANVINELTHGYDLFSYTGTRGWTQDQMEAGVRGLEDRGLIADGELTDRGRALREEIEGITDSAEQGVVDHLGADLDDLVVRLEGWAQQVVEQGGFPDDPAKRAAG